MRTSHAALIVVGLTLLGGSGATYYYRVQRPLTWPRTQAVVVSSRVINPRDPNQYTPELVLRLQKGERRDQVTLTGSWSSSWYETVKRHVDRYPPGSSTEVAVNPEDDADVRYELGPTVANLLVPGVLAVLGILFAGAGIGLSMRATRRPDSTAAGRRQGLGTVATAFGAIGIVSLVLGAWMVSRDLAMLRSWPAVDAEAIAVQTVSTRSSVGNRPSTLIYDVQVTFRYVVNDTRFQSQATSGLGSASRRRRDELLQQFAAGTHHRIRHRPDDPNVIRHGLDYSFRTFMLSGGMALMGLIFIGFAAIVGRRM